MPATGSLFVQVASFSTFTDSLAQRRRSHHDLVSVVVSVQPTALNVLVLGLALAGPFGLQRSLRAHIRLAFFTIQAGMDRHPHQCQLSGDSVSDRLHALASEGPFTFILPILVISYLPAAAVCGWGRPYWQGLWRFPLGCCSWSFPG